jgi:23S rRNA (uracil1939-C5)-methyltransferase
VTALVLRHLEPLTPADLDRLRAFAPSMACSGGCSPRARTRCTCWTKAGPRWPTALPEFGITMPFKPTDFTQVNPHINRVLVERAVRLLAPQAGERVIDWFCGLGNFTLPLATRRARCWASRAARRWWQRARDNARGQRWLASAHGSRRATCSNSCADDLRRLGAAERWLVDPPREGAFALAKALADLHGAPKAGAAAAHRLRQLQPATLARDAGLLVHQAGYRCSLAGVVNMFPHTAHVESMAVFDKS